jgi:hypothetical protein
VVVAHIEHTVALIVPENINEGFVDISIVDVTGDVYHVLPRLEDQENDLSRIEYYRTDPPTIRIGHSNAERALDGSLLAFSVDATSGKSKVIVLYSKEPIFDELRPSAESVEAFAEALDRMSAEGSFNVESIDVGLMDTRAP